MASNSITHFISTAKDISDLLYIETYFGKNPLTPLSPDKSIINDLHGLFDTVLNSPAPSNDHNKGLLGILKCLQQFSFCKDDTQWQTVHENFVNLISKCTVYIITHLEIDNDLFDQILELILEIIIATSKHHLSMKNKMLHCLSPLIFDVVINNQLSLSLQKVCIKALTSMVTRTDLEKRREVMELVYPKLAKFFDQLYTCGDFDTQLCIVETILRYIVPDKNRKYFFVHFKHKNPDVIRNFLNVHSKDFDVDCRLFLNYINKSQGENALVISIPCYTVLLDEIVIEKPPEQDLFWIDFNRAAPSISLWCNKNSLLTHEEMKVSEFVTAPDWQLIVIKSDIVKQVKVKSIKQRNETRVNFKEIQFFIDGKLEIRPLEEINCSLSKCIRIIFPRSEETEALEQKVLASIFKMKKLGDTETQRKRHVSHSSLHCFSDLTQRMNSSVINETMGKNTSNSGAADGKSDETYSRKINSTIMSLSGKANGTKNSPLSPVPSLNVHVIKEKKKHMENRPGNTINASYRERKISNTKTKIEFQCFNSDDENDVSACNAISACAVEVSDQSAIKNGEVTNECTSYREENGITSCTGVEIMGKDSSTESELRKVNVASIGHNTDKIFNEHDKNDLEKDMRACLNPPSHILQNVKERSFKMSRSTNACVFSSTINLKESEKECSLICAPASESLNENRKSATDKRDAAGNEFQERLITISEEKNKEDMNVSHGKIQECTGEINLDDLPIKGLQKNKIRSVKLSICADKKTFKEPLTKTKYNNLLQQNDISANGERKENAKINSIGKNSKNRNKNKRQVKISTSENSGIFNAKSGNKRKVEKSVLNHAVPMRESESVDYDLAINTDYIDKTNNGNTDKTGINFSEVLSSKRTLIESNKNVDVANNEIEISENIDSTSLVDLYLPSEQNDTPRVKTISSTLQTYSKISAMRNNESNQISVDEEENQRRNVLGEVPTSLYKTVLDVATNDHFLGKCVPETISENVALQSEEMHTSTTEIKESEINAVSLTRSRALQSKGNLKKQSLQIITTKENKKKRENIFERNREENTNQCIDQEASESKCKEMKNRRSVRLQNARQQIAKIPKKNLSSAIIDSERPAKSQKSKNILKEEKHDYECVDKKDTFKEKRNRRKKQEKIFQTYNVLEEIPTITVPEKSNSTSNETLEKHMEMDFNHNTVLKSKLVKNSTLINHTHIKGREGQEENSNVIETSFKTAESYKSEKTSLRGKAKNDIEIVDITIGKRKQSSRSNSELIKNDTQADKEIEILSEILEKGKDEHTLNNSSKIPVKVFIDAKSYARCQNTSGGTKDHRTKQNETYCERINTVKIKNKEIVNSDTVNKKCDFSHIRLLNLEIQTKEEGISGAAQSVSHSDDNNLQVCQGSKTNERKNEEDSNNKQIPKPRQQTIKNAVHCIPETVVNTEDENESLCIQNVNVDCIINDNTCDRQTSGINETSKNGIIQVSPTPPNEVIHTVTKACVHAPPEHSLHFDKCVVKGEIDTVIKKSVKVFKFFSQNVTHSLENRTGNSLNIQDENESAKNDMNTCIEEKMYIQETVTNELKSTSTCQKVNKDNQMSMADCQTNDIAEEILYSQNISEKTSKKYKSSSAIVTHTRNKLKKCAKTSCSPDCKMYRFTKSNSNCKQNSSSRPERKRKVVSYVCDSLSDESDAFVNKKIKTCVEMDKTNGQTSTIKIKRNSVKKKLFTQNHVDIVSLCSGSQNSCLSDPTDVRKFDKEVEKPASEIPPKCIYDEFDKLVETSPPPLPKKIANRWEEKYRKEKEKLLSEIKISKSTTATHMKRKHCVYSDFDTDSDISVADVTNKNQELCINPSNEVMLGLDISVPRSTKKNFIQNAGKNVECHSKDISFTHENSFESTDRLRTNKYEVNLQSPLIDKDISTLEIENAPYEESEHIAQTTSKNNIGSENRKEDQVEGQENTENIKKAKDRKRLKNNITNMYNENNCNSEGVVIQNKAQNSNERSFGINTNDNVMTANEVEVTKKHERSEFSRHENDSDFSKSQLMQNTVSKMNPSLSIKQKKTTQSKFENTDSCKSRALTGPNDAEEVNCGTIEKYNIRKSVNDPDSNQAKKSKSTKKNNRRKSAANETVLKKGNTFQTHEIQAFNEDRLSSFVSRKEDTTNAYLNIKIDRLATQPILSQDTNVSRAQIKHKKSHCGTSMNGDGNRQTLCVSDSKENKYSDTQYFGSLNESNYNKTEENNLKISYEQHINNVGLGACTPNYESQCRGSEDTTYNLHINPLGQTSPQSRGQRNSEYNNFLIPNTHLQANNLFVIQESDLSHLCNKPHNLPHSSVMENDDKSESDDNDTSENNNFCDSGTHFKISSQTSIVEFEEKDLMKRNKFISKSRSMKKQLEKTGSKSLQVTSFCKKDFDMDSSMSSSEEIEVSSAEPAEAIQRETPLFSSNIKNHFQKLVFEKIKYVKEISSNISQSILNYFSNSTSTYLNERIAQRKALNKTVQANIHSMEKKVEQFNEYIEFLETKYEEIKDMTAEQNCIDNETEQRIHNVKEAYEQFTSNLTNEQEFSIQELVTSLDQKYKKEIMRDILKKLHNVYDITS